MSSNKKSLSDRFRFIRRLKRSLRKRDLFRRFGQEWDVTNQGFQNRSYNSYEAYLEHQKAKLETHDFGNYDTQFRQALRTRLVTLDIAWPGLVVLCLGARIGSEVKAFLDLGCFAVGVDLNPGPENRYVLHGDFHDLQFPPHSVDVAYTNSVDHLFNLERLANEVMRVLKPNGLFIVEAANGSDAGVKPGFFESFFWNEIDDLVRMFENAGFTLAGRFGITYPWPGEAILLKTTAKPSATAFA
jgi:SAM-dependent methyltransferase